MKKLFIPMFLFFVSVIYAANIDICAKENRIYKIGEPVTFTATAWEAPGKKMTQGKIKVTCLESGAKSIGSPMEFDFAKGNPVTFSVKIDNPGFIYVMVSSCTMPDGKIVKWAVKPFIPAGGAAVEPEKIRQGEPMPSDFRKFWDDGIKRWKNAKVTLTADPGVKLDGYNVSRIKVDFPDGSGAVDGFLAIPVDGGKYPVIVNVPGAGPGAVVPIVAFNPKIKAIRLIMNVHNFPTAPNYKEQQNRYKKYNDAMPAKIYSLNNADNREEYIFRKAWLSVNRALEYATSLKEFNGKDVLSIGSSQGGGTALAVAALNPKVSCVVATVPALCDHGGWRVNRQSGWPALHKQTAGKADKVSPYFDAANFASFIKVPVFMSVGYVDRVCFPTSCYSAFNNLKGEKVMFPMYRHGHQNPAASIEAVRKFIDKYIK